MAEAAAGSVSRGTMADSKEFNGILRQAMAYRVKYRVMNQQGKAKKNIPLEFLGVHPSNRGGVYPTVSTLENLNINIVGSGFSEQEANHEAVCVQEVPECARPEGYETLKDYNIRQTRHSDTLSVCFSEMSDTCYGTLSRSHLTLIMLGWQHGAKMKLPDSPWWKSLLNPDDSLNEAAVAAKDEQMAAVFKNGLHFEVLSYKMVLEEPQAASVIAQALNKSQQVALATTELTALAVLNGIIGREMEDKMAQTLVFETVKDKVRGELDMFVDDPEFIDLFEFVISLGASHNSYVGHLINFGSKFVDQKQRRLHLSAFGMVNKMPVDTPRTKIAVIEHCYRQKPTSTYCPNPSSLFIKNDNRPAVGLIID